MKFMEATGVAGLLRMEQRPERAAELLGLADAHPATPVDVKQTTLEPLRSELSQALSDRALAEALDRGRSLNVGDVVAAVLVELRAVPVRKPTRTEPS